MTLGTLQGAAASAAGVFQVSILQAGDWARVSTPAGLLFFQHIALPQIGTMTQSSMLSWALVSIQFSSKCQTFTYLKSCRYVGL